MSEVRELLEEMISIFDEYGHDLDEYDTDDFDLNSAKKDDLHAVTHLVCKLRNVLE